MAIIDKPASPSARPSTSLVLGAGGARGYAHIGVIEELLAQGFDIRSLSGSSMGALVGGIYAAGKLDAYRDWVTPLQRLDVMRLLDVSLGGGGMIKGDRVIAAMREMVGDINIEDLPIPYTAVAVDLHAQREVWFSNGPLFDAIRASISVPAIFRPYHYKGRLLVDGSLLNPLPISPTLRDLTDCTIAVDINAPAEPLDLAGAMETEEESSAGWRAWLSSHLGGLLSRDNSDSDVEPSMVELFVRSLDTVQETITRLRLAAQPPDLLITIPRNACAFHEFYRADELIELGRMRTREALARWHRPQAGGDGQLEGKSPLKSD